MPQAGFEPTISASERPQTHATGIGDYNYIYMKHILFLGYIGLKIICIYNLCYM